MNVVPDIPTAPLDLAVRIGCKLRYETTFAVPMLLNAKPPQHIYQLVAQEALDIAPIKLALSRGCKCHHSKPD